MTITPELLKKAKDDPKSLTDSEAFDIAQYQMRLEQSNARQTEGGDYEGVEGGEYQPYATRPSVSSLADLPDYVPEADNDNVLILGRWLERGSAAFVVSTAGTGKSILSMQMALMWSQGLPCCGFRPRRKLRVWLIQSEDSETRLVIDKTDIIAELSETNPTVDWERVSESVKILKIPSKVGSDWLAELDGILSEYRRELPDEAPDVLIINPLLAYIGGPVTNGEYVTPFLRGGEISRKKTCGLQDLLERNKVGAVIFHHTPKPPNEKELAAWLKSSFPEYQGAGSSDITNWGRSFVTMMRLPSNRRIVCMTAGKNGAGLKWRDVDGGYRKYLRWSEAESVDGGARHAWVELTDDEVNALLAQNETTLTMPSEQESKAARIAAAARNVAGRIHAAGYAVNATQLKAMCEGESRALRDEIRSYIADNAMALQLMVTITGRSTIYRPITAEEMSGFGQDISKIII